MARIKESSVEAVKQGADLQIVVEERTSLRKQGARLVGRCPFHDERTPSFGIDPVAKLYKCFGCGKGGDTIRFVEETQGLDFVGAIEWLADRFRIPLEYEDSSPAEDARRLRRKRLLALLDDAATFYERYLWDSPGGSFARDYLAGRGLGEEVCREFRLGLAIGDTMLARKAREKGYTAQELLATGLTRQNGSDYFNRRLVFPLADARGAVVGFQARRLHEDDPLRAKYVNTPESELFTKGAVVYGLDRSRSAIAKEDRACIVEGNTDVLALRQAGFEPVVACMGTALTEQQLRELGRLTKRLWLAFDGDAAGQAATLRGMELAVTQGFDVKVVALPVGVDPADDPGGFEGRLTSAKPYVLHRTQVEAQQADDRDAGWRAVESFLNSVPDSPDRREAWRWANDHFGMTIQLRGGGTAAAKVAPSPKVIAAADRIERGALAGVIAHPELVPILARIPAEQFRSELHRSLRAHLVDGTDPTPETVELKADLHFWALDQEGIDKATAQIYLLRMNERELQFELQHAEFEQVPSLSERLLQIREAIASLEQPAAPG
jgi:DNA primase